LDKHSGGNKGSGKKLGENSDADSGIGIGSGRIKSGDSDSETGFDPLKGGSGDAAESKGGNMSGIVPRADFGLKPSLKIGIYARAETPGLDFKVSTKEGKVPLLSSLLISTNSRLQDVNEKCDEGGDFKTAVGFEIDLKVGIFAGLDLPYGLQIDTSWIKTGIPGMSGLIYRVNLWKHCWDTTNTDFGRQQRGIEGDIADRLNKDRNNLTAAWYDHSDDKPANSSATTGEWDSSNSYATGGKSNSMESTATGDGKSKFTESTATSGGKSSFKFPHATGSSKPSSETPYLTGGGNSGFEFPHATGGGKSSSQKPYATDGGKSGFEFPHATGGGKSSSKELYATGGGKSDSTQSTAAVGSKSSPSYSFGTSSELSSGSSSTSRGDSNSTGSESSPSPSSAVGSKSSSDSSSATVSSSDSGVPTLEFQFQEPSTVTVYETRTTQRSATTIISTDVSTTLKVHTVVVVPLNSTSLT
jgi:hypothetical protein